MRCHVRLGVPVIDALLYLEHCGGQKPGFSRIMTVMLGIFFRFKLFEVDLPATLEDLNGTFFGSSSSCSAML